jgi:hypothetical protein
MSVSSIPSLQPSDQASILYRITGRGRSQFLSAIVAICVAVLFVFQIVPASAAEPVFPLGSHIGLVPPPGMVASKTFPGFEDAERKVTIQLNELPPPAYEGFLRSMSRGEINVPGVSNAKREILITQGGGAHLLVGDQESEETKFRKWLLITRQTISSEKRDLTMAFVVTAQVPDDARGAYPEDAIRKALSSVALRSEIPGEESLSLLPFKLTDLGGFDSVRSLIPGRAVLLSDEPLGNVEPVDKPFVTLSIAPGRGPQQVDERRKFSEKLLQGIQGYKDLKIVFAEQIRLGNQYAYEIRLDGKYEKTGGDVMLVQWVRFGAQGFVRLVGITPKEDWVKNFPRFRAVRDGIENR